jgi:D-arabinitol dehydrogenase (NADP+)
VVFERPGEFRLAEVPDPHPGPGEVLLRTVVTGVCGTDRHLLAGGFLARYPLIPGHEMVAEVQRLGPPGPAAAPGGGDTRGLAPGDLVAVDNTVLCGHCDHCRRDQPLYCRNFYSLGVNGPGGFADLVVARAEKCFPLDGLAPMTAVLTEPLACAVHGADVLALRPGSDVLVFGAGPTGLLLAQLLLHGGAARLTVAAPSEHKLALARSFGVDETVRIDRDSVAAALPRLRRIAPSGFDAVIEATGSAPVLAQCPPLARTGGTILVYGMAGEGDRVPFTPYDIFARELTVKGSFAQTHCFDRAMLALRTGRVRTEGIVTDVIGLDRFDEALAAVASSASVKAVVTP